MSRHLLRKLAHVNIEAKKSHNSPSVGWRPWDAGSTAHFKSESLRTREAGCVTLSPKPKASEPRDSWYKSQSSKARESGVLTSKSRRRRVSQLQRREEFAFPLPFGSIGPPANWRGEFSTDSHASLFWKHTHRHTRK